ncbi:hypothetical protein Fcan01_15422 [Folsomia candida]|uniref:Uncharacterized protein n=1 Tax=Folsomia candida TaxID=158441 RepID=A0A226DUT2_FOLCA|nr:hypothetical protein Fcan01_15422 [Folsomia candida]
MDPIRCKILLIVHLYITQTCLSQNIYQITNFEDNVHSLSSSCYLSISYFGNFHVPPNIQRPYQLSKYISLDKKNVSNPIQANLLVQPIHPIFRPRHHHLCLRFMIIIPPGLSQEYKTVEFYTLQWDHDFEAD